MSSKFIANKTINLFILSLINKTISRHEYMVFEFTRNTLH